MGKLIGFYTKEVIDMKTSETRYTDLAQFAKIVVFFANNSDSPLYKTKLNKLLFYTQFQYYKEFKKPFFDMTFIKDHYGPVLEDLDYCLYKLEGNEFIEVNEDDFGEVIESTCVLSPKNYTNDELYILNKVLNKFGGFTSRKISLYSHEESLWLDTDLKEVIPVRRAGELNDF